MKVRLHAVLRDLLPGGRGEVELAAAPTIKDLLDQLGIEDELRELITVNGEQVSDESRVLSEGDEVEVFPAVAGGDKRSPYLDEGIRLFAAGDYFMAHETLEEHWIEASEEERDFYQGLIHLAVAFHHLERGNTAGTKSQMAKALRRLDGYPDEFLSVPVGEIRSFLKDAPARIEAGEEVIPPRLAINPSVDNP